ncbi:MAG: glycosyltransferase family 39 protein [Dehalococcoidia bacterium]|nr:glycosyltransferase family 39 protein [Dehalococcoidia bacterium]
MGVVSGFMVLAFAYSVSVPIYEAPDEPAHVEYAHHIASETSLPDMSDSYEAWQPPLYYTIGGVTLKIFGLDSIPQNAINPQLGLQSNAYIHGTHEAFPYSGGYLTVHVLRWISVLFGAGALVFIYMIAITIFPQRKLLALSVTATAGLVPQFAFTSGYATNDIPAVFFATAVVFCGLRLLREPHLKWAGAAAVALALGGLTKSSVVAVAAVPLLACVLAPVTLRAKGKMLAVMIALPAVVAGPFYLRNIIQWGAVYPDDLLPFPTHPRGILDPGYRQIFLPMLRQSYWYYGGWLTVVLSPILYDILNVASVLAVGGAVSAFVSRQFSEFQHRAMLLLALTIVLAFLGTLYISVFMDWQPQGRYLFPAQAAFAMLFTFGIGALFSRDHQRESPAVLAMPVMLVALNVSILLINLPRAY